MKIFSEIFLLKVGSLKAFKGGAVILSENCLCILLINSVDACSSCIHLMTSFFRDEISSSSRVEMSPIKPFTASFVLP